MPEKRNTRKASPPPHSGVELTVPEESANEHRELVTAAVAQIADVLDSTLILAEAEKLIKKGTKTALTDEFKTRSINQLLQQHPDFMVKALADTPPSIAQAIISTKGTAPYLYPQSWWPPFFTSLAVWGSMRKAVQSAEVSYHQALLAKASSPTFKLVFDIAMALSVQTLEDEAKRRALGGSDLLMIFMLKGAAPEKYKERVEVVSPAAIRRKAERLAEKLGLDPDELMKIAEEISNEDGTDD